MTERTKDDRTDDVYEKIGQAADKIHDRVGPLTDPTLFNNAVDEYVNDDENEISRDDDDDDLPQDVDEVTQSD
jgi:hypothetical protein